MESDHYSGLPVGYEIDGYRLDGVLGSGGFGITYLATEIALDRRVAIKEFLPGALAVRAEDGVTVHPGRANEGAEFAYGLDRFRQEARTLVTFDHPNVVGVHRYVEANGTAYLVMQYLEGETLDEVLHREGRLDEERLTSLALQLLDGLAYVHGLGYLHRDVKPENIYMTEGGRPVLLDFGAARQALTEHSRSLTAIVTAGYAPYEQYHSGSRQGPYTDLYALGAVLYRCATGREPVEATARMSALIRGRADPLEPARALARGEYSDRILGAIDAAMAVAEDERPQTVDMFRSMIEGRAAVPGPIEPPPAGETLVVVDAPVSPAPSTIALGGADGEATRLGEEETRTPGPAGPAVPGGRVAAARTSARTWLLLAAALVLVGGVAGASMYFLFDEPDVRPGAPVSDTETRAGGDGADPERPAPEARDTAPAPEGEDAARRARDAEAARRAAEERARRERESAARSAEVREALRERLADLVLGAGSYETRDHRRSYSRVLLDEDGCGAIVEQASWLPGRVEGLDGRPALIVTYRLCLGDLRGAAIVSSDSGGMAVALACRSPGCIALRITEYEYRSRENLLSGRKEITGHALSHRDGALDRITIQMSRGDPSQLLDFAEKAIQAYRD